MGDIVFLGRLKNCHDLANGCFYIDTDGFQISDARHYGYLLPPYDKIDTYLSEKDYAFVRKIVSRTDDPSQKIIDILTSDEASNYFEENIIPSEKEWVKKEWNFSENDVEHIFESYINEYQDRTIISVVFQNLEQFGKEKAENFISANNEIYNYIDFVKYAEDLLSEQPYTFVKTEDDRVVELMY